MSTATIDFPNGAFVLPLPGRTWYQKILPPPPPRTIEECQRALSECGALQHLTAPNMFAKRALLTVDNGPGQVLRVDGYHILTEQGKARLALISRPLLGTYLVAPFGGHGFVSLGVEIDAADSMLHLFDRVIWQRTVLGRTPFELPIRQLTPRGRACEARYADWVEIPVPERGMLTWCAHDHQYQRREGTNVVGWPGVHRTRARDLPVFIKVVREPEALAAILENERFLKRAMARNPALADFVPLACTVWTQGVGEITGSIPGDTPGCAVMIEQLFKGPTLDDLASGSARLAAGASTRLHARQVAACGRLAALGLLELNRHAPPGERLLAPDATKGDNLICAGTTVNRFGEPVPHALVCPDRDHFVSESNPRWRMRGTMFGTDVRSLRAMMATSSFALVEAAHVFQVGRMLLALASGCALPVDGEEYGPDLDANLDIECRHYARALAQFDRRRGEAPSPAAGALGALIRSCCALDAEHRPTLPAVIESCHSIAGMGG